MGSYSAVDSKASSGYEPTPVLRKLAKHHGADIRGANSEAHVRRLIDEAKARKPDKAEDVKHGEVIPPRLRGYEPNGHGGPQIIMNVPAPQVNVKASVGPQWFDVVSNVQNAVLYMVLGAALYAVFGKWVGL